MTNIAGSGAESEWGEEERSQVRQHLEGDEREIVLSTPDEQELSPDPSDLDAEDPAEVASNELHPAMTPAEVLRNERQGEGDDDE
jgi:hypothetical protein